MYSSVHHSVRTTEMGERQEFLDFFLERVSLTSEHRDLAALQGIQGSLVAQMVKDLPAMEETQHTWA